MYSINYLTIFLIILALIIISIVLGKILGIKLLQTSPKQPSKALQQTCNADYDRLVKEAAERFMLLSERLEPSNLLSRVPTHSKNAVEYRMELLKTVDMEYNHNVAWQLYITSALARLLKTLVSQLILNINMAFQSLPEQATALDLSKAVLKQTLEREGVSVADFQEALRAYVRSRAT